MVQLAMDKAKLVRFGHQRCELVSMHSWWALPGPASGMKLHVIKRLPHDIQELLARATEVDAVMEMYNRKTSRKRGDVRVCWVLLKIDLEEEVKGLKGDLA